ncbi:MAG: competence/damage-inducible protein A [Balneolaceae bacterium]
MKAHILSIGNELLIGDTVNTNAAWIGRFLTDRGFDVEEIRTVSDDYGAITGAILYAMGHAGLVISTGGLGPTHDDITKKAVADLFESDMVLNDRVLSFIRKEFARRGRRFTSSNRDQAMVPADCEVLFNEAGTAPGMWFEKNGTGLAVLPGIPYEVTYLMKNGVDAKLRGLAGEGRFRAVRYLKTAGVPESTLSDEVIGDLGEFIDDGNDIAYLPGSGGVTIRVSRHGASTEEAEKRLAPLLDHIEKRAGGLIFGEGRDLRLSEATGRILTSKKLSLSVAESCTGGLISDLITDVPGSSAYFSGGVIAYADPVKTARLGVRQESLAEHGAVSMEVALQMAGGVADSFSTDIGVSATGVAGPGGGSEEKPVGTVWMGFRIKGQQFALKAYFTRDRRINKERTGTVVLETVRRYLLDMDSFPYDLKPHYPHYR